MHEGAPLVRQIPGRAGWELRCVVQGGLRILEKIKAMATRACCTAPPSPLSTRPTLLWRSCFEMREAKTP